MLWNHLIPDPPSRRAANGRLPPSGVALASGFLFLAWLAGCAAHLRVFRQPSDTWVQGQVAPGCEGVRDVFIENFRERGEVGAAVAAYHRGQPLVDLWGGYRDVEHREPWDEHTLVLVFSTTKGMTAAAAAKAVSLGWLDYDAAVAKYWPEFASNGKAGITVRQLLNHEAGLAALDARLGYRDLADLDALSPILANQSPWWPPGTRHGYHSSTLGLYVNELIRRADPQHRSLGHFFQDEVARPLGVTFFIGVPEEVPEERMAYVEMFSRPLAFLKMPWKQTRGFLRPSSLFFKAMMLPYDADPNLRAYRAIELGSGNGTGEVRAIAKVYGDLANEGTELGISSEVLRQLADSRAPLDGTEDVILKIPSTYSLGFLKPGDPPEFGTSARSFGTPGLGGSFGFADPDRRLGFAYAMVKMGYDMINDPRERRLRDAVYACLPE